MNMKNDIKIIKLFRDEQLMEDVYVLTLKRNSDYQTITLTESEVKKLSSFLKKLIDNKEI